MRTMVPAGKQQHDTVATLAELSRLGVPADKVRIVFNMVDDVSDLERAFDTVLAFVRASPVARVSLEGRLGTNEICGRVNGTAADLSALAADPTDYKSLIAAATDSTKRLALAQRLATRRLASGVVLELDACFAALRQDVHAHYGAIHALRGINLKVDEGEIVTLIGANGAGKSTLVTSIFGAPRISSGRILFKGEDITRVASHKVSRLGIALSPEGRRIFPRMTVPENLQMGATFSSPQHWTSDVARVFSLFPVLEERNSQRAGTLSGGEQQMLAIGRALVSRPRLLLLDEPSLGLAPTVSGRSQKHVPPECAPCAIRPSLKER
jgi:ABC-type branched-subunit amino acid transport system ATPase component